MSAAARTAIPRYRSPALTSRLPPAKLPLFRSVVQHPPAPFAVEAHSRAQEALQAQGNGKDEAAKVKGKGKAKASPSPSPSTAPLRPLLGPTTLLYTPAPRPLIPLTSSPVNHLLWNPPAADSVASRAVEKDESGRLSKFASRFNTGFGAAGAGEGEGKESEGGVFGVEADLSWLEGTTAQSPGGALGKRDIVGPQKAAKKGKK
ncbi:hypothetical protein JCM10213_007548 [Rhodosporidiobolus nylandii]